MEKNMKDEEQLLKESIRKIKEENITFDDISPIINRKYIPSKTVDEFNDRLDDMILILKYLIGSHNE